MGKKNLESAAFLLGIAGGFILAEFIKMRIDSIPLLELTTKGKNTDAKNIQRCRMKSKVVPSTKTKNH